MQHTTASNPDESWKRPLSEAPVTEYQAENGEIIRIDQQGRVLCHAHRRDKKLCMNPRVTGMKVCRLHGGSTQAAKNSAKIRLAELVNPAIATLAREMTQADSSADKQRAANSILDRAGYGRQHVVQAADAQDILYERLLRLAEEDEGSEPTDSVDSGGRGD